MDADEIEKNYQESVERLKSLPSLLAPKELLGRLREIQEQTQRQAETGRIFQPPDQDKGEHKTTPPAARQVEPNRTAKKPGVLLEKFRGAGSTPSRRRFWDKVTQAVIGSQKVAGRNVSVNVHDGYGTVVNVDRKQGTVTPSLCNYCSLPDGDCPHAIAISVSFDAADIAPSYFLLFIDSGESGGIYGYYYGDGNTLEIGAWGSGGFVDFDIPTDTFLDICIQLSLSDPTTVEVDVSIAGIGTDSFTMDVPNPNPDSLYVGARFEDNPGAHRTIRCVSLLNNPDSFEGGFIFPPGLWMEFIGGASIVGGALRIDDDSGDAYAEQLSEGIFFDLGCTPGACCFGATCESLTDFDCVNMGGSFKGVGVACDPNPCVGACCFSDGSCSVEDAASCMTDGGSYGGDLTVCDPNTCPQPSGACCFSDSCSEQHPADCASMGGSYEGDDTLCEGTCIGTCCCATDSCGDCCGSTAAACTGEFHLEAEDCLVCPFVCCIPDFPGHHCEITTLGECDAAGGSGIYACGATCDDLICS